MSSRKSADEATKYCAVLMPGIARLVLLDRMSTAILSRVMMT